MGTAQLLWLIGIALFVGALIILGSLFLAQLSPLNEVGKDPVPVSGSTSGVTATPVFVCPADNCAFDLQTGVKTCPTSATPLAYDPGSQGCTPTNYCFYSQWTNALLPDGSTDPYGRCAPNQACSCSRTPLCGPNITSAWTFDDGQYSAINPWVGSGNTRQDGAPLVLNMGQFCTLPAEEISSLPGVECNSATVDDIRACYSKYQSSQQQLCPVGSLAFYSEDSPAPNTASTQYQVVCAKTTCPTMGHYPPSTGVVVCPS